MAQAASYVADYRLVWVHVPQTARELAAVVVLGPKPAPQLRSTEGSRGREALAPGRHHIRCLVMHNRAWRAPPAGASTGTDAKPQENWCPLN